MSAVNITTPYSTLAAVTDTTPPVITILGANPYTVTQVVPSSVMRSNADLQDTSPCIVLPCVVLKLFKTVWRPLMKQQLNTWKCLDARLQPVCLKPASLQTANLSKASLSVPAVNVQ